MLKMGLTDQTGTPPSNSLKQPGSSCPVQVRAGSLSGNTEVASSFFIVTPILDLAVIMCKLCTLAQPLVLAVRKSSLTVTLSFPTFNEMCGDALISHLWVMRLKMASGEIYTFLSKACCLKFSLSGFIRRRSQICNLVRKMTLNLLSQLNPVLTVIDGPLVCGSIQEESSKQRLQCQCSETAVGSIY